MSKFFDSNRHLSARQEGCFYRYFGKIIVWRIAQALCFVSSGDLNLVYTIYYSFISFKIKTEDYDDTIEQQLNLMYSAIKKLNDIDKALVFLYLEDKSYREISETLGITEVNARVKMNRAKEKLRKILNP